MTDKPLTKVKIITKRLLGRYIYIWTYLKKRAKNIFLTPPAKKDKKPLQHKNTFINLITLAAERWQAFLLIITLFLSIYYGLGAAVSSTINKTLNTEIKKNSTTSNTMLEALAYVLKTQIDDSQWTPALPAVFPAAVLDNLPNFQLGVKDSTAFFIKRFARYWHNKNLKEAGSLLDYPADIWLFSQTKDDKLAPGSAKQYRKALGKIAAAEISVPIEQSAENIIYILKSADILLTKELNTLNKHIQEHSSELLDFKADNIFYKTQGSIYTLHYLLTAVSKNYQEPIVENEQYENMTAALKALADGVALNPFSVKNASPDDAYEANHLLYLAYFLSQAQNRLQKIYFHFKLKQSDKQQ